MEIKSPEHKIETETEKVYVVIAPVIYVADRRVLFGSSLSAEELGSQLSTMLRFKLIERSS